MISDWLKANSLTLNTFKTVPHLYTKRKADIMRQVYINGKGIKEVETVKHLEVLIDSDMKFASHIKCITSIISGNIGMIAISKPYLTKIIDAAALQFINASLHQLLLLHMGL